MQKTIKSFLCLLFALITVFSSSLTSFAYSLGDVDMDKTVTAADARTVLRAAVSLEQLSEQQTNLADMDKDKIISSADARLILRAAVSLNVVAGNPKFEKCLYETAHPLLGQTKPLYSGVLKNFQKWCCYYTVEDVFRTALKNAGYSSSEIDRFAPTRFSKDSLAKAVSNLLGVKWPAWATLSSTDFYVPSLLADYYIKNSAVASTYFFYTYYDDVVESKVYNRNAAHVKAYRPKIGDILFMSNKTKTYKNGYPTIDHTAQIIKLYDDGAFLTTEGSIIESKEGDGMARVRERVYRYNSDSGTYEFINNSKIICLLIASPKL